MSSVHSLREFIGERLTAAAAEIFAEFEKTIVQYEEVIDRQRRLLDVSCRPEINTNTAEPPQQHVCKQEEVLSDQQPWNQQRNSSLDQEEPELLQMKEEHEELCSSQEGQQLVLKQETDTFMLTSTYQEGDLSEVEANTEQLYSHSSPLTERTDQDQSKSLDSGSTTDLQKEHHRHRTDSKCADHSHVSTSWLDAESGEKPFKCHECGKAFRIKKQIERHYRTHTSEKPFLCRTCGKSFSHRSHFLIHMRSHTGEKPHKCKTCGKAFAVKSTLLKHTRIHTGERPFLCRTCGKSFSRSCGLLCHMRVHTGERPYSCEKCGKDFTRKSNLNRHMKVHTDEKADS